MLDELSRLVSIRNYIALKPQQLQRRDNLGLVSIRNYIALKHHPVSGGADAGFSIHTKLHRSKTIILAKKLLRLFSIHTKLHRSKTPQSS